MDRLLRTAFERLIRTGNLRVITAGGATFTCGDGTGRPAAIRFATRAAERAVSSAFARLAKATTGPCAGSCTCRHVFR